jgi:hypothetical protein
MHIGFRLENQKERDQWGDLDAGGGKISQKNRMGWCGLVSFVSG